MKYLLSLLMLLCSLTFSQTLPFYTSFNSHTLNGWTVVDDEPSYSGPSNWFVSDGNLRQSSNIWAYPAPDEFKYHLGTHIITGDSEWQEYSVNALVRSTDNDGIGIIFNYQDAKNYYRVMLLQDSNNGGPVQRIQKYVDGEPYTLFEAQPENAIPKDWFAMTADVRDDSIKFYINSELIGKVEDMTYNKGKAGFFCYANSGAYFDSLTISNDVIVYDAPENPEVFVNRKPYIQMTEQESVGIAWRTTGEFTGKVKYGTSLNPDKEISEPEATHKHYIDVEGLTPATKYYYEVYNDVELYHTGSFKTKPADTSSVLSFLLWGDSGTGNNVQYSVAEDMESEVDNVDFGVHVGDVSQGSGDEYDIIYFTPYKNIVDKINVYTCIGNHDTYYDNAETYLETYYYPSNNNENTERYYSFRWGNALFINIDSNLDYAVGSPQYNFIRNTLINKLEDIDWVFTYFHHPPYCELWDGWAGSESVRQYLLPLFELHGVDMVLNGHTHGYERGALNGVHYIISGGGGGGLDGWARDWPHISVSESVHHYTKIDINDKKLKLMAFDTAGNKVDAFTINKNQTDIEEDKLTPNSIKLNQNYPNPFNPDTKIRVEIPESGSIQLYVTDILGKKINTIYKGNLEAGAYTYKFNGTDYSSGIYFYNLYVDGEVHSRKMLLLK